jgi:hypothetical protein
MRTLQTSKIIWSNAKQSSSGIFSMQCNQGKAEGVGLFLASLTSSQLSFIVQPISPSNVYSQIEQNELIVYNVK